MPPCLCKCAVCATAHLCGSVLWRCLNRLAEKICPLAKLTTEHVSAGNTHHDIGHASGQRHRSCAIGTVESCMHHRAPESVLAPVTALPCPCRRASQSVLCRCHRARKKVPVPKPSCLCHCVCFSHLPAPFGPCHCSAQPSCQCRGRCAHAIVPGHCARAIVPGPTIKHSNRVIHGVARLPITRDKTMQSKFLPSPTQ